MSGSFSSTPGSTYGRFKPARLCDQRRWESACSRKWFWQYAMLRSMLSASSAWMRRARLSSAVSSSRRASAAASAAFLRARTTSLSWLATALRSASDSPSVALKSTSGSCFAASSERATSPPTDAHSCSAASTAMVATCSVDE